MHLDVPAFSCGMVKQPHPLPLPRSLPRPPAAAPPASLSTPLRNPPLWMGLASLGSLGWLALDSGMNYPRPPPPPPSRTRQVNGQRPHARLRHRLQRAQLLPEGGAVLGAVQEDGGGVAHRRCVGGKERERDGEGERGESGVWSSVWFERGGQGRGRRWMEKGAGRRASVLGAGIVAGESCERSGR